MKKRNYGLVNATLLALAVFAGIMLSLRPWNVYQRQRVEAARDLREMHDSEKARADLLRKEAHANSSIGKEEMVRESGRIGPGDLPAPRQ